PGQFQRECDDASVPTDLPSLREDDFNQPSVWVSLEKKIALDALPSIRLESGTMPLDTRMGRPGSTHERGLHAFARAQTYYHRPGVWAEHPNFFNPFWRARLAAALQGRGLAAPLQRWLDELPESLRQAPDRVLTH